MATTKIEITNIFAPDASGDVFSTLMSLVDPGTNGIYDAPCWQFNDPASAVIGLHGVFGVPEEYSSAPIFRVVWVADDIVGDAVFEVDYTSVGDTASLDPAAVEENVTTTTTVDGTAWAINTTDMACTAGNFAAGDTCACVISRDTSDAAETLGSVLHVVGIFFVYTTA